jgi:hypothetical protein
VHCLSPKYLYNDSFLREKDHWRAEILTLAGLRYPVIDTGDIPDGFCDVDVKLDDNGQEFDCKMVAGHVGYVASAQDGQMNTLQPCSEWFMFITGKQETEAEAMERMMAEICEKYSL